jgi:hypothetical protein
MSCGLRERLDGDLESEVLKSTQVVAGQPLGVQAIEVGGAQVGVGDAFAEDVPHRDEDTVADRDGRLLGAPTSGSINPSLRACWVPYRRSSAHRRS